ncbi:ArdC family protein [Sphingomonas sp. VNH70]|uniref:ArdC family protein n=1 Tax=Sphingomonas silueang TaxID=3156617 RepID=UPI0032B33FDD
MSALTPRPRDLAGEVTRAIIARIEAGAAPWQRPWSLTGEGGRPLRHDGTPYQGVNCLYLWAIGDMRGVRSRYWMTRRQAETMGARVRAGAEASLSVYASTFRKGGQPALGGGTAPGRLIRFLRHYVIYSADDIDGLPDWYHPREIPPTPLLLSERQGRIDAFFAKIPAEVRHGGDRAFYSPLGDYIQLPRPQHFRSGDDYASTRAHETLHWSGARSRLDRTFGKKFGDRAYAFEELIAELGASMLCAELGLPAGLRDDHAGYLAHWLGVLRTDTSAIFLAAAKAEQAVTYLRGLSGTAPIVFAA